MASGDGGVRKRTDEKYARSRRPWIAWIDLGAGFDDRGRWRKRIRREHACASQREGKAWLAQQRAKLREHGRGEGQVPKVRELLNDWLRRGELVEGWSPRHLANSQWLVRGLLQPLHDVPADELTVRHVRMLLHAELSRGRSPNTLRLARNVLRSALNMAAADQLIPAGRNVAQLADAPPVRRRPPRFLPPDAIPEFLAALEDCRLGALYLVGLTLALRPSEALGLKWDDVELERRVVTVRRSIHRVAGEGYVEREPKADGYRAIHLPEPTAAALRRHRNAQREERLSAREWTHQGYVFTNSRGGPVYEPWANRHLRGLLEQVDERRAERLGRDLEPEERMPRVTFYGLRHSAATLRLALGENLETLQETMGHSSIGMTRRYAQVLEPALRNSADQVGAFLEAASAARVGADVGRRPSEHESPPREGAGFHWYAWWSGRWDSNPRPSAWKADALPLSYSRSRTRRGCSH